MVVVVVGVSPCVGGAESPAFVEMVACIPVVDSSTLVSSEVAKPAPTSTPMEN